VITALWLLPLAFGLVFGLPPRGFELALAGLLLIGAWEFRRLAALEGHAAGWLLVLAQAILFAAMILFQAAWVTHAPMVLLLGCAAWLLMFTRLATFRPGVAPGAAYRVTSFASALAALSIAWLALSWLRLQVNGSWWILALLLSIWAADIGAYFSGRALGKRKLAPALSPGKTLVGLAGGLTAGSLAGWAAVTGLPSAASGALYWLAVCALTVLFSVGGDLFISLHKRTTGTKDSGRIFPGHGGVLDRLDSLLAGAPVFALGVLFASSP